MRFFTLAVTLLLIGFNAYPQEQQKPVVDWMATLSPLDYAWDIAVSEDGDAFVVYRAGENNLLGISASTRFVVKYNTEGVMQWYSVLPFTGSSFESRVTIMPNANVAVTNGSGNIHILSPSTGAIINNTGSFARIADMVCDSDGNLYTIGRREQISELNFGDTVISGTGIVVQKFDSNLEQVWFQKTVSYPENSTVIEYRDLHLCLDTDSTVTFTSVVFNGSVSLENIGAGGLSNSWVQGRLTSNGELLYFTDYAVSPSPTQQGSYGEGYRINDITSDGMGNCYAVGRIHNYTGGGSGSLLPCGYFSYVYDVN